MKTTERLIYLNKLLNEIQEQILLKKDVTFGTFIALNSIQVSIIEEQNKLLEKYLQIKRAA